MSIPKQSDVLVIGGGVIGMSCAFELSERGCSVTVIDKGEIGYGCSYGNAGWLTPCFALPLPMPGQFFKSIGWLLDPDSPLYIKPEASWTLVRWLFRFLKSMNQAHLDQSVAALTEISDYSLRAYRALDQRFPGAFGFQQKGLLMVASTTAGVASAEQELDLVSRHNIPGRKLNADDVHDLEPALTGPIKGGVYFTQDAHAEPLAVVKTLSQVTLANGGQLIPRAEAFDFEVENGIVKKVITTKGEFTAKQIILATGSWSVPIARKLGLRIPVLGGKGYALIVPPFDPPPRHPIMILEKKIAVTPRNGSIRLAGTLELVDRDESITPRRVQAIVKGAREFMNVPQDPDVLEVWRGLRPCTPDGVPIIDYAKDYKNLFVVTGHQMLGLQSALGTGRLAADMLTGAKPAFNPYPFRASRF